MRIGINFHTFDRYISGVEYYTLGMINALLCFDRFNEYVVFTNAPEIVEQYVSCRAGLVIRKIGGIRNRTHRILWEHFQLPRLAKQEGLDVLHCPSYICPVITNHIPSVVTVHDTIAIDHPRWCKPSNALYFNLAMRASLQKAARIIAVSQCTAEDIKRNFPLNTNKIMMIYPGIDSIFNAEKDTVQQEHVRLRYNLPQRYLLFVGNLEPKKNIPALLSALHLLQKGDLFHRLVIVGHRHWGPKSQLKTILQKIGEKGIVFAGYVARDDLPAVYHMADVVLFPSLYEGFGFPALEAMACGVPVIASSRGALAETAADAAFVIDPESPCQIANAISQMLTNKKLREKHIRLGYQQSSRFGWGKTAAELLKVYNEVVDTYE